MNNVNAAHAPTRAERLAALVAEVGGSWDRTPQADGSVRLRLHFSTGEVIAGNGADTEAALADLEGRARAYINALRAP